MISIECITLDCANPAELAAFWSQALNWPIVDASESEVYLRSDNAAVPGLLLIQVPQRKEEKLRLHLDLRPDNQAAEIERLLSLGAQHVDIGQHADSATTWVVLADPEGNEFCVLRAR